MTNSKKNKIKLKIFNLILLKQKFKKMIIVNKFKIFKLLKKNHRIMKLLWRIIKLLCQICKNKLKNFKSNLKKMHKLNMLMKLDL